MKAGTQSLGIVAVVAVMAVSCKKGDDAGTLVAGTLSCLEGRDPKTSTCGPFSTEALAKCAELEGAPCRGVVWTRSYHEKIVSLIKDKEGNCLKDGDDRSKYKCGPFAWELVDICANTMKAGNACYGNRWSKGTYEDAVKLLAKKPSPTPGGGGTSPSPSYGPTEKRILAAGLVDVQTLDSSIRVSLPYATTNNFLGQNVYGDLKHCFLQPAAAKKLKAAQAILKKQGYGLFMWDCARPRSVQQKMWDVHPNPNDVAPPWTGSKHNYGMAVDVTLVDSQGRKLDCGSNFDEFGRAQRDLPDLSASQSKNQDILENALSDAGFLPYNGEWWHYDAADLATVKANYEIIE